MILLAALASLFVQDWPEISADPPCRPAETVQATVSQIGRDVGRFVDRCVRVSGLLYQGILHDNRESLYLARLGSWDGGALRSSPIHHLWVGGPRRQGLDNRTPVPATVVGRIDTCDQRHRRNVGEMRRFEEIVVASSHCYAAEGQLIMASEVVTARGATERMTGEAARQRFGNLAPMPAAWPERARTEAVTGQFLAALRSGDRERVAAIHGIRPGSRDAASQSWRRLIAYMLEDLDSPFASFRRAGPSQVAYFVPRLTERDRGERTGLAVIACFCRARDCRDRWPISTIDTRHQPGRPYACTSVFARDWVPAGVELETDPDPSGPREPARTAVRDRGSTRLGQAST